MCCVLCVAVAVAVAGVVVVVVAVRLRLRLLLLLLCLCLCLAMQAVLIFNRFNTSLNVTLDFQDIGNTSMRCWNARDIWQGRNLGRLNYTFGATLLPHACRFLRLSAPSQCGPS